MKKIVLSIFTLALMCTLIFASCDDNDMNTTFNGEEISNNIESNRVDDSGIINNIIIDETEYTLYFVDNAETFPAIADLHYENIDYGFSVNLPSNWENYPVEISEWSGQYYDENGFNGESESGSYIEIRPPSWTAENPAI